MPTDQEKLIVYSVTNGPSIKLLSDIFEITLEVHGKTTPPPSTSDFVLWLSLPIAMSMARDLHIEGPVSALALANAKTLVGIWSKWIPHLYSHIDITTADIAISKDTIAPTHDLMLYSGGLDSTYSLLKHYVNPKKPVSLLTIQGMDYKAGDNARFNELKNKIKPLTSQIKGSHYFIKSNAAEVMNKFGIDGGIGHGFHLFGSLCVFQDDHPTGVIAADCTPTIDFIITPWGTNHLINHLFSSERFSIKTLDNNIDRAEKTGKLLTLENSDHALAAITFCKNRQSRPHNCGRCSKCIRTKAMFHTETGSIPDIFTDRSFKPTDLGTINLSHRGERALVLDLLASARRNGKLEDFIWLEKRLKQKPKRKSKSAIKKLLKSAKKIYLRSRAQFIAKQPL